MHIDVSLDALTINGNLFTEGVPLDRYVAVLGTPARTAAPGAPAPYGHRNNQLHFFDNAGLYVNEHHLTCLIQAVDIILAKETHFPTTHLFHGTLLVCGMPLRAGMSERELLEAGQDCVVRFRNHLGRSWVADGERIAIDMDTYAERTPSGRKSRRRWLSYVSVGFREAHPLADESEARK